MNIGLLITKAISRKIYRYRAKWFDYSLGAESHSVVDEQVRDFLKQLSESVNCKDNLQKTPDVDIDFSNVFLQDEFGSFWPTGKHFKINIFSPDFGDYRKTWEINRLQFLPTLACQSPQKAKKFLESWIMENPPGYGINWTSNLEVAMRSLSILFTFSKILGYLTEKEQKTIMSVLFAHGRYLALNLPFTRLTMRNNHYLAEMVALTILSKLFGREDWDYADSLVSEIDFQFFGDGGNFEKSLSYHSFSLGLSLLAYRYLFDKKQRDMTNAIIVKALSLLNWTRKPGGLWPDYGDNDGAIVIPFENYGRDTRDFSRVLDNGLKILKIEPEEKNKKGDQRIIRKLVKKKFPETGLYVLRKGWDRNSSFLMISCGRTCKHGHADLLAIEFTCEGNDILVDSGTYQYNKTPLRKYFRGTTAHNTVRLDGQDQSRQLRNFSWLTCAEAEIMENHINQKIYLKAFLKKGKNSLPLHQRELFVSRNMTTIECLDTPLKAKCVEVFWHFDPDLELELEDKNSFSIIKSGLMLGRVNVQGEGLEISVSTKETPYSNKYGCLDKQKTLCVEANTASNKRGSIKTSFILKRGMRPQQCKQQNK